MNYPHIKTKNIIWVLTFSLIARMIFFNIHYPNLWDDAVYIGIGKFIFSWGTAGLFEPIRPLILSSILGLFWKLNLNIVFFGKIFQIVMSIFSIYLLYLITKKIYNEKTALIASLLISFTPTFFFLSFSLIPGILATFFLLLSFYFLLNKKNIFLTGIFLSLSFLTKFYYGLFIIIIGLYVLVKRKNIVENIKKISKEILLLGIGLVIPLIPYFILNLVMYKNVLYPFIEAQRVIGKVVACNILNYHPWYYFFVRIFTENFLLLFFIIGIYFIIKNWKTGKKRNSKEILIMFSAIITFIYLIMQSCKTPRYILFFLPFMVIIAGNEIAKLIEKMKKGKRIFVLLIFLIILSLPLLYYSQNEGEFQGNYPQYALPGDEVNSFGPVLSNSPFISINTDDKITLSYYPLHTARKMKELTKEVKEKRFNLILIDGCNGDLFCHPKDTGCEDATKIFLDTIKEKYDTNYIKKEKGCNITLFRR